MSKMSGFSIQDIGMSSSGAMDRNAGNESRSTERLNSRQSALADLVSSHLRSNGLRQIDFCRQVGFDQGLLSKILSSVVSTLNVETVLKLAEGMRLPPRVVFEAIGKSDVHEMLMRAYSSECADRSM